VQTGETWDGVWLSAKALGVLVAMDCGLTYSSALDEQPALR